MVDYIEANDIGTYCEASEDGCQVRVLEFMNCIAQCLRIKSKLELKGIIHNLSAVSCVIYVLKEKN